MSGHSADVRAGGYYSNGIQLRLGRFTANWQKKYQLRMVWENPEFSLLEKVAPSVTIADPGFTIDTHANTARIFLVLTILIAAISLIVHVLVILGRKWLGKLKISRQ